MLMITMKLPGTAAYDSQMEMHTSTTNPYISLSRELKKILHTQHRHIDCWITSRIENMITNSYTSQGNKKLAFNFPHVSILGIHHCVKERSETFKRREDLHDVFMLL